MLKATDLTREFETAEEVVAAVDGVDLELADGEFAAVVGASGSGKSTLLALLGTLDQPTSGTIEVGGVDIGGLSDRELTAYRRSRIGFVFQSYNLIPNLSALQNVMLPMEFAGVPAETRHDRAENLLTQVGLDTAKQHRRPGRLSGGEQQRVAIARAMANRPCVILADEPTGNLDSDTGNRIVELLRNLAKSENVTVVAVTHDTEIAALADRTFQLRDGQLTEAVFPKLVQRAIAGYDAWLAARTAETLGAFVSAVAELVASAPSGRRLSAGKIRARYPEAVGVAEFDEVLAPLDSDDLLADE